MRVDIGNTKLILILKGYLLCIKQAILQTGK